MLFVTCIHKKMMALPAKQNTWMMEGGGGGVGAFLRVKVNFGQISKSHPCFKEEFNINTCWWLQAWYSSYTYRYEFNCYVNNLFRLQACISVLQCICNVNNWWVVAHQKQQRKYTLSVDVLLDVAFKPGPLKLHIMITSVRLSSGVHRIWWPWPIF